MKISAVKLRTHLQPILGRDNDPRGEHSATVNTLESEPVKLLPTRSDAGSAGSSAQRARKLDLVAYRAKNDRRAGLVWQLAYNRYQLSLRDS
jgi:hypothetical protein